MRFKIKLGLIAGMLLVILVTSLACSGVGAAINTPAKTTVVPSTQFKVANLTVNPPEVNAGVQTLITARVTNTGTKENQYQGNVRIDDTEKSSLPSFLPSNIVKIAPGETQIVSTSATINSPGVYSVSWDGVTQPLKVNPEVETLPTQSGPVTAPDFTGVDVVTGKSVSLSQYKDSAVLLNFVNYGCSPSLNQIVGDQLLAIRDLTQQRQDFTPISVFCGCCPPEVLRQFARDNGLNWPWILDTSYSITQKYGNYLTQYGYPTLIFIDTDQVISGVAGATDLEGLGEKIDRISANEATK
jgi:hypothetical protein